MEARYRQRWLVSPLPASESQSWTGSDGWRVTPKKTPVPVGPPTGHPGAPAAAQPPFIEVRLPAMGLILAMATDRAGTWVDALVESDVGTKKSPVFRVWALANGLTAPELGALTSALHKRYGVEPTVQSTQDGDRILYEISPQQLTNPFWGALLAFQTSFGPPWLLFSEGLVTMRAQGVDCGPEECADRLRKTLALAEVQADVHVVHVPETDLTHVRALQSWRQSVAEEADQGLRTPLNAIREPGKHRT
jgi:hypothetical protein